MGIILRDYQLTAKENIKAEFAKGTKRVCLRSEVGSGKTVIFSDLAYSAISKGTSTMVVCNRQKLVRQSEKTLVKYGLKPYILMQTSTPSASEKLIIASSDTLRHRPWPEWVKMVIIDECHLASFTYVLDQCVKRGIYVLGVSATPIPNKSNKLHEYYEKMIKTKSTASHIIDGELVLDIYYKAKVAVDLKGLKTQKTAYGVDYSTKDLYALFNKPKVYDDMINNYLAHAAYKKAVCFCTSVEHSKKTAENFRAHGISATHIDGNDPESVREKTQADFEAGKYHILCNCAIYTFGWDCPAVEVVIVNRSTASYELWRQMIGRGARPFGTKEYFLVIDQGGNYDRHGGLIDEVEWTLDYDPKKKSTKKGVAPTKHCKKCEAIIPASSNLCPVCKEVQPQKQTSLGRAEFELLIPELGLAPKKVWPLKANYEKIDDFVSACIEYAKEQKHHANSALHHILAAAKDDQVEKRKLMSIYASVKNFKQGWIRNYELYRNK